MQLKRMNFYTYFKQIFLIKKNSVLLWDPDRIIFNKIDKFRSIPLDLLIGIEKQKNSILENTINFAKGHITNNALLWGVRGSGKSTLIKSAFNELKNKYNILRLIQLNKNDLSSLDKVFAVISKYKKFRFIIFIDDLSFEKNDSEYKTIKSTIDGSLQIQPSNIILYVTSNRRHLMSREMIDNEKSSAIHVDESVEEKVSLSDRFGLWIGFHNLSQNTYINIIKSYCEFYNIEFNNNVIKDSIQWSLQRGNRTGRTAWQFIINISSKNNQLINY